MSIEEHIENLKAIASDMPSDKCSDWIESLMAGINAMEELQAHRNAWMNVVSAIDQRTEIHSDGELYIRNFDVKKIIAENIPKS